MDLFIIPFFCDYLLVWRSFEIVLMEIYAEEGIWW